MSVTESQVNKAKDAVHAAMKKVWAARPFTHARRMAELNYRDAVIEFRKLRAQYRYDKRKASAGGGSAAVVETEQAAKAAGITTEQMDTLIAAIRGLMEQGTPEDVATSQVLARVSPRVRSRFPHHLIRRFARPRFRPVPGTVARPARSIDPVIVQQGINPRARGRSIDPIVPFRNIDPVAPGISIPASGGAFDVPSQAAVTVDQAIEQQDVELAAAAEADVPWYKNTTYLAIGAGALGLALLAKKKSGHKVGA